MRAIENNRTWDMVPRLKGVKPVGRRCVFNLKYKADGTLETYKARLVAKWYNGIAIGKMMTLQFLLSLTAYFRLDF